MVGGVNIAYTKTVWVNGTTLLNETNLNNIEDGIETNDLNKVEKTGDTMTGDLNLQDDIALTLGTDTDMSLYHDNANNKNVIDNGAIPLEITYAGTETMAVFNPNWKVELYYDDSVKLETTNAGVLVTGDLSTSTGNTVDTNANDIDDITITQTDTATTLTNSSWIVNGSYFYYDVTDANITATMKVDVYPFDNDSMAKFGQMGNARTEAQAGSFRIHATKSPIDNLDIVYAYSEVV